VREKQSVFFMQFGFESSRWEEVADALKRHAKDNEITLEAQTVFGTRYVIDGLLTAPDGRRLNVRTAWFVDDDGEVPRFITAHPLRRRRRS
jgi:uncharacterized protein DUF6883